jgi:hypothetical protein
MNNEKCINKGCHNYDAEAILNCDKAWMEFKNCPDHLISKTASGSKVPCSAGLVAKLIEIDSLIRCAHLDMGGNDKYHISPRHNDRIGKLIKECLYIAEGN